jgi:hypothetical protein
MARHRIAVEWAFRKVANMFGFVDHKKKLEMGLSPIGEYYFVSVLLANIHTCSYGSQTSSYFECSPPTVREYLGTDM